MGNVGQLVVFVALGVIFLSWGFQYSLLDILAGVLLFIVFTVGYFQYEEIQKKKKSQELQSMAVPSQPLPRGAAAAVGAGAGMGVGAGGGGEGMGKGVRGGGGDMENRQQVRAPFLSVTSMKFENRSRIAPGIKPRTLQFKCVYVHGVEESVCV